MKTVIFFLFFYTWSAVAAGKYGHPDYVICDVNVDQWTEVQEHGYLDIPENSHDPFIHCARPSQLYYVMNKYFKGTTQVILVTHASLVSNILKYENDYPHLYGRLYLDKVVYKMIIGPDESGHYDLPEIFTMPTFDCLYFFSTSDTSMVEIKRTDLPAGSPLKDIYKWLIISLQTGKIQELHFKSMTSQDGVESRVFEEGEFQFNTFEGHLKLKDQEMILKRQSPDQVSHEVIERIKLYL